MFSLAISKRSAKYTGTTTVIRYNEVKSRKIYTSTKFYSSSMLFFLYDVNLKMKCKMSGVFYTSISDGRKVGRVGTKSERGKQKEK